MCNYFRPALLVRVGRRLDLASLEFGRKSRYHRSKPGQLHVYSKLIFFSLSWKALIYVAADGIAIVMYT